LRPPLASKTGFRTPAPRAAHLFDERPAQFDFRPGRVGGGKFVKLAASSTPYRLQDVQDDARIRGRARRPALDGVIEFADVAGVVQYSVGVSRTIRRSGLSIAEMVIARASLSVRPTGRHLRHADPAISSSHVIRPEWS